MEAVELQSLFTISYPKTLIYSEQKPVRGGLPFISSSGVNNGIAGYVAKNDSVTLYPGGAITVPLKGTVLQAFYQPRDFYVAHQIAVLYPQQTMPVEDLLFYVYCIRSNKFKFNYGRQADKTLHHLMVPAAVPVNWSSHPLNTIKQLANHTLVSTPMQLQIDTWQPFNVNELFVVTGTKTTSPWEIETTATGPFPYVTTQSSSNGVAGTYNVSTESGNVLTVDSAVVGYCSYQAYDFSASDHVEKLQPNFTLNKYIAQFLTTIINLEQYRYNYGRKASQDRLKLATIKLPATTKGQPDWDYMERYIKSLAYSASI